MTYRPYRQSRASRALTAIASLAMRLIADVEVPAVRLEPQPGKGIIIVTNHRSLLDLPVGLIVFRHWGIAPQVFARDSLFRIPLIRQLLNSVGCIPAGRNSGSDAISQGLKVLYDGGILAIAPEGKVSKPTDRVNGLGFLYPGAGRLAATLGGSVLLVGIANTDIAWPLGRFAPRFHLRTSRKPRILVSASWLSIAKATPEADAMIAIRSGLQSILQRIDGVS